MGLIRDTTDASGDEMGGSLFTRRKIMEMQLTDEDYNVVAMVTRELRGYNVCLETLKLRDALKHILAISRLGNGHIQAEKPWKLVKGSPEEMYDNSLAGNFWKKKRSPIIF